MSYHDGVDECEPHGIVDCERCVIDALRAELDQTEAARQDAFASRDALAKALREYGQHKDSCNVHFGPLPCACGLDAALAGCAAEGLSGE